MQAEESLGLQQCARRFVQDYLPPHVVEAIDKHNQLPPELYPALGRLGLLGITAPTKYGGLGQGYYAHCQVIEEIGRASAAVALSYGAHSNLCINQLVRFGTEEQKQKCLPKLISGEWIGALAMSEKDAGSDVLGGIATTARLKGQDMYDLNGSKMWITNGALADVVIVYARTDPSKGNKGLTAFIVEKGTPGFHQGPPIDLLGMRCGAVAPLEFSSCKVPSLNVLGGIGNGAAVLMSGLDYERLVLSAIPVGMLQACLDIALPYACQRKQFQRPIAVFQMVQSRLSDLYVWLRASRAYVAHVAHEVDAGSVSSKECAAVFLFTSQLATKAALHTIQILGGSGYTNQSPAGRLLRDAKLCEIGGGTVEVRRLLIAREMVKDWTAQEGPDEDTAAGVAGGNPGRRIVSRL